MKLRKRISFILIIFIGFVIVKQNWGKICFQSQSEDSGQFGNALAINKNYLAVGDPKNNQVVIYTKDKWRWNRSYIIEPPADSHFKEVAAEFGLGFGQRLSLNDSNLIISAYAIKPLLYDGVSEKFFEVKGNSAYYLTSIYQVDLNDSSLKLERIDQSNENTINGRIIASDGDIVVFDSRIRDPILNTWTSEIKLVTPQGLKTINLQLPKEQKNQYHPITDIDIKENRLIIGTSSNNAENKTHVWLFNIDKLEDQPIIISVPQDNGGPSVEISSEYAVISTTSGLSFFHGIRDPQILIYNLEGELQHTILAQGRISLDHKLLMKHSPLLPGGFSTKYNNDLLVIFSLGGFFKPYITEIQYGVDLAIMKNSFLVTVKNKELNIRRICIKKM